MSVYKEVEGQAIGHSDWSLDLSTVTLWDQKLRTGQKLCLSSSSLYLQGWQGIWWKVSTQYVFVKLANKPKNKLLSLSSQQETLGNNRGCLWHFLGRTHFFVDLIRNIFWRLDCPLNSVQEDTFGVSNRGLFRSLVSIKRKVVGGFVRRWLLLLDTLEGKFKRKLTLIFLISWGNSIGLFPPSGVVKWGCRGQRQWFMDVALELGVLNLKKKESKVWYFMVFPDKLRNEVLLIQPSAFWWSAVRAYCSKQTIIQESELCSKISRILSLFVCFLGVWGHFFGMVLIVEECVSWEFFLDIASFAIRFCDQVLMFSILLL